MPPKKNKKKNNQDLEDDYCFGEAQSVNSQQQTTDTPSNTSKAGEDTSIGETPSAQGASKGKKSKAEKKKNKKPEDLDEFFFGEADLDDDAAPETENVNESKPSNEADVEPVSSHAAPAPKGKKSKAEKKKNKKTGDLDEFFFGEEGLVDDVAPDTKAEAKKAEPPQETEPISSEEVHEAKGKKGDKKSKKKQEELREVNESASAKAVETSNVASKKVPANKKKQIDSEGDEDDDDDEGEGFKRKELKTAAEKKAEKKKRDAEKRRLERQKEEERLAKLAEQLAKQEEKERAKRLEEEERARQQQQTETAGEQDEDAAGKGAKGGKKKDSNKEKTGGGGGGLSAAAKKALQEELDRKRAEEERLKREREDQERRAEELRRQQEEKERLEQERKERKKQKKKEDIARQKAEGTYLTKAQKEERARMELAKQLFLEQGGMIPAMQSSNKDQDNQDDNETQQQQQQKGFLPPKRKPGKGKRRDQKMKGEGGEEEEEEVDKQQQQRLIEEQKKVDVNKSETSEHELVDNWEDKEAEEDEEEEVEDWEQLLNEEEGTESDDKKEKKKTVLANGHQTKEEQISQGLNRLKLQNGAPTESKPKQEVEDEESSDDGDESSSEDEAGVFTREEIKERIKKRREESEAKKDVNDPRCAVVCVLGHVDTGKTKILDKIRRTNVQDGEAGGITQQIGATNMPQFAITEWSKSANVKDFEESKLKLPGFLVIDTPGHESFTNLRTRGSSLCDLAILVVDIMHGLEPQTLESIQLLKNRQAPFVVALNKIDRLFEWKPNAQQDIRDTIKKQKKHTREEFESRLKKVVAEFAEKCELNVVPFWDNQDPATYVSICPTSAHTGDGMGNLIWYMVTFCQSYLKKRLAYRTEPQATVLEVKEIQGLGTTIDVILVNGKLKEGNPIIVAGYEGPIQTHVKALLVPPAMKELRVKNHYDKVKQVRAATGVKILARDVEKALAGMPMLVAARSDELELLTEEMQKTLASMISSIKLNDKGVYVQASTLGSLEALLEFLKQSQIPYSGINIGPVHKKDVMKATTMLEHNELYGVILAFDVKVEREAQDLADSSGIKIFTADIIYHLFDKFQAYKEDLKQKAKDKHRHLAMFPCKLRILPNCIFNTRDPIIIGVTVEAGIVKAGTQLCVPSKEGILIGTVATLEMNNRPVDFARQGSDVCLKIENTTGEAPKLFGRHFDATDLLVSKLSRDSIDALKDHFRDEMTKNDWLLVKELKTVFRIV